MIESYPLYWPEGRHRTGYRGHARFKTGFGKARDALLRELQRLGARDVIISSNIPLRHDGLPRADAREPADPGIAVYFKYKNRQHCFACDKYNRTYDNMHAINLTIAGLRGIARWGTGDMMERAFRGFEALPAPQAQDWRSVLGVNGMSGLDVVRQAYLEKARQAHPDKGGSHELMQKINSAWEAAQLEIQ